MNESAKQLLDLLVTAPETQLAKEMIARLKELEFMEHDQRLTELRKIYGECAFYSLASSFVMHCLVALYELLGGNLQMDMHNESH